MAVLLLAEWEKGKLSSQSAKAYSAAQKLGLPIDILLIGDAPDEVEQQALKLPNLRTLLLAKTNNLESAMKQALEHGLAETVAVLIAKHADAYSVFMAAATSYGKNIMPHLSGLLEVPQISDIIDVIDQNIFKRPIYAGNVIETVRVKSAKKIITVRASAFAEPEMHMQAEVRSVVVNIPDDLSILSRFIDKTEDNHEGQPDLGVAKVVVSGGRGLGSAEDFKKLLEPLAEKLHAAIGASRAAVDAEFTSNDRQVGQTGRVVSPDLYFAIGLSGAVQHVAGMSDSGVIVAINKDPEAPIFKIADYGLVGDLFEIVPLLTKEL